jgi:thymidylate kinase
MHILFEGLDLAGKSTVCRMVRAHFGGDCSIRRNSILPPGENAVHQLADRLRLEGGIPDLNLGHLYYAALLEDLRRFEPSPSIVIQDSTILGRSMAYHKSNKTPDLPALFQARLAEHPRFDVAFYCRVTPETRVERLALRRPENLAEDDFLFQRNPDVFAEMERILMDYVIGFHGGVCLSTDGDIKNDESRKLELLAEILEHLPAQ